MTKIWYLEKVKINKFLAPFLGIGMVHFLSLEVDILKNGDLLILAICIFFL